MTRTRVLECLGLCSAVGVVATAAIAGSAGAGPAAFPGRNGLIVFTSARRATGEQLYLMRSDGRRQRRITRRGATSPRWAADGSRIVFIGYRSKPVASIYVAHPNGRGLRRLTHDRSLYYTPAWSPDGKRIVFARSRKGSAVQICTMNTNGSGHRQLTSNALGSYTPAWSPNGKTIAFSRDDRIWLMNANGTNQRPLSQPPSYGSDEAPAWSPDGHSIAFVRALAQEEPESDIYVVDADGTGEEQLTGGTGGDSWPAWSPDGRRIVFASDRRHPDINDIYVMNSDGTGQRRLTSVRGDHDHPDWQPVR